MLFIFSKNISKIYKKYAYIFIYFYILLTIKYVLIYKQKNNFGGYIITMYSWRWSEQRFAKVPVYVAIEYSQRKSFILAVLQTLVQI